MTAHSVKNSAALVKKKGITHMALAQHLRETMLRDDLSKDGAIKLRNDCIENGIAEDGDSEDDAGRGFQLSDSEEE